ncbi:MAG: RagB/SusD family nutrient uptake outer membrane protein, partial [Chitinophagaceae bacterium]
MKIKIIIAILLISLGACKKNFLELPSQTSLSTPVFFKSQSDFQQAINGAYAPLRALYSGNNGAWVMGELRSDNTAYKFNPNDRGQAQPEFIKDFTDDANNPVSANKYFTNYTIIARVNQVLAPIDGVDFDATVKNNIKGQAYFLRAFAYFDLVQYFGKVPLHLKPANSLAETALPLTSVDSIYLQIIADAKLAATLLPNKATQEAGRATSGAAKTLLGNVYIVLKRWAEAETTFKEVTGYSLLADYNAIYNPAQKNHAESIFEIQYKEGTEGFASNFFYTFLVQPISSAEITAVTGIPEVPRTIEGYNIPTPDIIAAYEANDKRKDASIAYITASAVSYPYIKKYSHAHALTNNTNDNWPVYRYAEVLLFLAEALNEQNKTAEALTNLNLVRTRAGLPNSVAAGQVAIRDAILKERRVELAFENKRYLDLVRSGTAEAVLLAFGAQVKANPQAYYFPVGIAPAAAAYTTIRL